MIYRKCFPVLLLAVLSILSVRAQQLDILGDCRILGNLDISNSTDSTSIHIGRNLDTISNGFNFLYNTFLGHYSGLVNSVVYENSFFGERTGSENINGSFNSFFGGAAGDNNLSGSNNVISGRSAGKRNSSGYSNTFIGSLAARVNTSGFRNVFVGNRSGYTNESGNSSIALGCQSLQYNLNGYQNIAIGFQSLDTNLTNYNIGIGTQALYSNTTGLANTALGGFSGYANVNTGCVFMGYGTGSTANVTNSAALGFNAKVGNHNKVRIGDGDIMVIEGNVAFSPMSDERLKENISPIDLGIAFIRDLHPIVYHRISNQNPDLEMGLIAQELDSILIKHSTNLLGMINRDSTGILSVRYNDLMTPLIKTIKDQQLIIEKQTIFNQELLLLIEEQRMINIQQQTILNTN
ncbi:MAG: tail fiber domain-containing protein [Saprospiraceae bacterium]|nr:tail fiber domain-containing protein [Saprospiraceae bacterium]